MAAVASPYGLRPLNLVGGQSFNGGVIREYSLAANNSAAIFNGDLVTLSTAGLASAVTATPIAMNFPTTPANATAGIMGVCVGARYVLGAPIKQQMYGQYLPANATTAGYTDIWIRVMDDPDAQFQIQAANSLGSFNSGTNGSGWRGAIGKNCPLTFGTSGSTTTGNSGVALNIGTDGGNLAATQTLAMRIIDVVQGTQTDAYPEFIVKFNVGVHSYYNNLGI